MFPAKARTGVGGEGCATYPDLVTQDILHLCIEIPSYTLSIYTIIVSIKNLKHIFKTLSMITQLVAASAGIRTLAIRSTYRHIITVSMTQLWRRVCHIIYWSWDSDTVESTKKNYLDSNNDGRSKVGMGRGGVGGDHHGGIYRRGTHEKVGGQ